jgi:hypothetical protein
MASSTRNPDSGLVLYSDRGVQFTSWAFSRKLQDAGLAPSMGAVGAPGDNAMLESFWGRMQVELLNRKRWKTRLELATASTTTSRPSTTPKTPQHTEHTHTNRIREPLPINRYHHLTPNPRLHKNRGRSLSATPRRQDKRSGNRRSSMRSARAWARTPGQECPPRPRARHP